MLIFDVFYYFFDDCCLTKKLRALMEKKPIGVIDSSISFVASYIIAQVVLAIFAVFGIIICNANGYSSAAFTAFVSKDLGLLISVIVMNMVFVGVVLFVGKTKTIEKPKKIVTVKLLAYIALAFACYFVLYPVVASFNKIFNVPVTQLEISRVGYIYSIFSRVLIPAICEELLFRGIIFKGLETKSKHFAILVSAVMFSLFHMSKEQLIYPLLMGLLFGVIMAYENNIIYCIIVHIINNSLALAGVGYYFNHWTYYLVAAIMFVLFVGTILFLTFKQTKQFTLTKIELITLLCSLGIMIVFWVLINFIKL